MLTCIAVVLGWSLLTAFVYLTSKRLYRRWPKPWLMPVVLTPATLICALLLSNRSYAEYDAGAGWLVSLVGPATFAFAVPIYERRAIIRKHWVVLGAGVVAGSVTALASSYALATYLGIDAQIRASLVPRSFNTPFAMTISGAVGGIPSLTAFFVVLTGVSCAVLGKLMIALLRIKTPLAKGALLGMGGHAAGTAKAFELGKEEGTVASLIMVLAGLLNVALSPLIAWALHLAM